MRLALNVTVRLTVKELAMERWMGPHFVVRGERQRQQQAINNGASRLLPVLACMQSVPCCEGRERDVPSVPAEYDGTRALALGRLGRKNSP